MTTIRDAHEQTAYPMGDAALWARIFHYIRWRCPARAVTWTIEGEGAFDPPLKPVSLVSSLEVWRGDAWEPLPVKQAPVGILLPGPGIYRVTATVGDATVPDAIQTAYDRLSGYMLELNTEPGATSISDGDYSVTRSANAAGRALQYSGAADLLRAYR